MSSSLGYGSTYLPSEKLWEKVFVKGLVLIKSTFGLWHLFSQHK